MDGVRCLSSRHNLVVLRDAANYITALPAKEAALPEWQAAIEALILVVELGGPTMFRAYRRHARIEPAPRSGVRSVTKGASLGAEEAQEGCVMDIYDGADWTEMDIEGIET